MWHKRIKMCDKIKYKTKKQATTAMNTIKKTSNRNDIPKRVYYCKECQGFVLTHYLKP